MGEASRRKQAVARWFDTLSDHQLIVAKVALKTYKDFIRPKKATGMCYRMTFFMKEYLALEHDTEATAVVGYVNDGTDDIMVSHAWLEFEETVTDITLAQTIPELQTGALLVLNHSVRDGKVTYSYHKQKGEAGEAMDRELKRDPSIGAIVEKKRMEHEMMVGLAADPTTMRSYLDAAPDGMDYEKIAAIVRG